MHMSQRVRVITVFSIWLVASGALWSAEAPAPVSPGGAETMVTADQRCPTFIWGALPGAKRFELAVYAADDAAGSAAEPVLTAELPGSVQAWVPPAERCLEPGSKYAWTVRAVGPSGASEWSEPSVFQVAAAPSNREVQAAMETLARHLDRETEADESLKTIGEKTAVQQVAPPQTDPASVSIPSSQSATRSTIHSGIVIEGNYEFSIPHTGYYRIPGNSLVTGLDTLAYSLSRNIHGYSFVSSGPFGPYAVTQFADVHLPALSTVNRLTCWYQDNSAAGGIGTTIQLRRRLENQSTSTSMASVTISTTGPDQSTDVLNVQDNSIANPLILNSIYDYFLFVPWSQSAAGSFLRFYGCEIRYTYTVLAF